MLDLDFFDGSAARLAPKWSQVIKAGKNARRFCRRLAKSNSWVVVDETNEGATADARAVFFAATPDIVDAWRAKHMQPAPNESNLIEDHSDAQCSAANDEETLATNQNEEEDYGKGL